MDPALVGSALVAACLAWWVVIPSPRLVRPPETPKEARRAVAREGFWGACWRDLAPLGRRFGTAVPAGLEERLVRAGRPAGLSATEWSQSVWGANALVYLAAGVLAVFVARGVLPMPPTLLAAVVMLALPGLGLPDRALNLSGKTRVATLEARLPDLTGRIAVACSAGLPVRSAFQEAIAVEQAAGRTPKWLQRELASTARLLDLSCVDLLGALGRLHQSVPADDLKVLMAQLAVGQESGAPIADTLRAFSRERRDAMASRRHGRVGTALLMVQLGGPIPVATLSAILVIYICNSVIRLASTPIMP